MTAPETPRPTTQGEGVAGGVARPTLDTDAIVALSPAEAETVARALQGDAIAARRLDRHDLADTLDDLATRIAGAVPVGSAS